MARRGALSVVVAGAWLAFAVPAQAASTPALVVDAASGKVLLADRATEPWFPASVTKLMTTYVALDLVRQGRFSMNSLLTLSPEAAAEPPSKMGFKPGTQLTLDNALKIIMVKSANDITHMIAENLGGSVDGYAGLMNAASRRLGMHESRWVNPHGLPDERQQTSARDMAILARALLREFPDQEDLFHIGALKLGTKIIRNHNGLLGRYPGADGMKTGFICMGGFNVVATATQNGRRLIAVVFGYPSAKERDLRAADLFDQGFSSFGWGGQQVEALPPSSQLEPVNMRSVVCGPNRRTPQEDDETARVASAPSGGNSDNPFGQLFAAATMSGTGAGIPNMGRRTTLGPRATFEPIPIWLGASPGAVPDDGDKVAAAPSTIPAKRVRTRLVGKPVPGAAGTGTLASTAATDAPRIDTVKTTARPGGRAALSANLDAEPAAETKPKLGSVARGAAGRAKHGAIQLKPTIPIVAEDEAPAKPPARAPAFFAFPSVSAAKTAAARPKPAKVEE